MITKKKTFLNEKFLEVIIVLKTELILLLPETLNDCKIFTSLTINLNKSSVMQWVKLSLPMRAMEGIWLSFLWKKFVFPVKNIFI